MPADVQTNYGISSVHVQWFSHGKSRADDCDVTHGIGGGKYIRKVSSSFGAVIWVSGTEWLGPLLSHQPSTLAISVPLMEQEYILEELFTLFTHVHAPRLFGNILVSMILVV